MFRAGMRLSMALAMLREASWPRPASCSFARLVDINTLRIDRAREARRGQADNLESSALAQSHTRGWLVERGAEQAVQAGRGAWQAGKAAPVTATDPVRAAYLSDAKQQRVDRQPNARP